MANCEHFPHTDDLGLESIAPQKLDPPERRVGVERMPRGRSLGTSRAHSFRQIAIAIN